MLEVKDVHTVAPRSRSLRAPAAWPWKWFGFIALALGTSYGIVPLFSSNQNHHFLIGLARAGDGWLADDWLSTTADPFPAFSVLVMYVHRFLADSAHYFLYYSLFGAYGYGLVRIAEYVRPSAHRPWPSALPVATERLALLAALCVLHNEAIGYLLGIDLSHIHWWQTTHWGVAEQEIFGHGAFQASSFGMLLPMAIALCLAGWPLLATALAGFVLVMHFSYGLTVASLTVGFMFVEFRRSRRWGCVLGMAAIAFACALPVGADVLLRLGPTSSRMSAAAADVLVQHLPQETLIAHWFGWNTIAQIGLMLAGLWIADGTDLWPILLVPFVIGFSLTLVQVATRSSQMALLFPWRASVLLVPVATALALRRAIAALIASAGGRARQTMTWAAGVALVVSVLVGAGRMTLQAAYFNDSRSLTAMTDHVVPPRWSADFRRALRPETLPMMRYVRAHANKGDLYVTPPELERFRLIAGAPSLADFKSHPYKDVEVLEWRRRLDLVNAVYDDRGRDPGVIRDACSSVDALRAAYPITHIVADDRLRRFSCPGWAKIYADQAFAIYQLQSGADAKMKSSP